MRASLALVLLTGCASTASVVDRSTLQVSDNSRVVARNVIPSAERYPSVVEHLGLAQEIYQLQLSLLKTRRDTLRSRTRMLDATSYAVFAVTTLGVGVTAIGTNAPHADDNLKAAGYAALGGLAAGTLLKVFGYMQEDPSAVDGKIRQLQTSYDAMLERVRVLGQRKDQDVSSDMAAAIESFIAQATQIDVKG